jgi:hypothetical protein
MSRKEELNIIIGTARDELYELELKEKEERNSKILGRYFKYLNSYGGIDNKWWMYYYYKSLDSCRDFIADTFQIDNSEKIEIDLNSSQYYYPESMIEITKEEYIAEWNKIISILTNVKY